MKTIIYTPEQEVENEIGIITQLLDAGADYLYIRKPELDDFSLVDYVEKIPEQYWKKCISTSLIIAKEFDLGGYHFTRDIVQRNALYNHKVLDWLHENDKISSVSAHSTDELKDYAGKFRHVMVSPLFKSISKENHQHDWDYENLQLHLRDCHASLAMTACFAVGGIDLSKIERVKNLNFDGIGLLGTIWKEPDNAMSNFNKILHFIQNDCKE
ncbi:MAG: thiamine phosphate synthase [Sphingobacteriales bacterium]|jgi:thiamine-phosphate pyrophosphorylase|nr:thiamine phosphate synthase [Sphingobacteriales bacterium]